MDTHPPPIPRPTPLMLSATPLMRPPTTPPAPATVYWTFWFSQLPCWGTALVLGAAAALGAGLTVVAGLTLGAAGRALGTAGLAVGTAGLALGAAGLGTAGLTLGATDLTLGAALEAPGGFTPGTLGLAVGTDVVPGIGFLLPMGIDMSRCLLVPVGCPW